MDPLRRASILVGLLASCFKGDGALGLPCDDDSQCGIGQRCEQGFCGGPMSTSSSSGSASESGTSSTSNGSSSGSSSSSTGADTSSGSESTGGPQPACGPPPPEPWICSGNTPLGGALESSITTISAANPTAAMAGAFAGSAALDIAVGNHSSRTITILTNLDDGTFGATDSPMFTSLVVDMVATDLECDGVHDLFTVGYDAMIESVGFDGTGFITRDPLALTPGGYSLAVGDVIPDPDNHPELLVAEGNASDRVLLLGLVDGELALIDDLPGAAGPSPWEIEVIATAEGPRVLVADSDYADTTMDGPADQLVRVLGVTMVDDSWDLQPDPALTPVADDFQNPYAIAVGDFIGDGAREVAIAERFVEGVDMFEGTTLPGRVRFFALGASFTEVDAVATAVGPRAMAAADLDCDGHADLVVSNGGDRDPEVHDGVLQVFMGGDTIGDPITIVDDLDGGGTRIAVGDFDGDGAPEAAVPDWGGSRVITIDID